MVKVVLERDDEEGMDTGGENSLKIFGIILDGK